MRRCLVDFLSLFFGGGKGEEADHAKACGRASRLKMIRGIGDLPERRYW
jgi:hypothetical protein